MQLQTNFGLDSLLSIVLLHIIACELAGRHYERLNKVENALRSFQQAEQCYEKWGSQMKVQKMQEKVENLGLKLNPLC